MVSFALPTSSQVTVEVYDMTGRRVRRLVEGHRGAGLHAFTWNGRDDRGRGVASGVYLVRAATADHAATKRAVLVR